MTSDDGIFADYMADDELSVIHQDEATLRALAAALDATCPYGLTHPKGSHLREAAAILEAEPRLTLAERHMKQSINGCVTCERPWSEHVVFTKIADPPVKPTPDFYRDTFESVEDAEMAGPDEGPLMAEQERLAAIGAAVDSFWRATDPDEARVAIWNNATRMWRVERVIDGKRQKGVGLTIIAAIDAAIDAAEPRLTLADPEEIEPPSEAIWKDLPVTRWLFNKETDAKP